MFVPCDFDYLSKVLFLYVHQSHVYGCVCHTRGIGPAVSSASVIKASIPWAWGFLIIQINNIVGLVSYQAVPAPLFPVTLNTLKSRGNTCGREAVTGLLEEQAGHTERSQHVIDTVLSQKQMHQAAFAHYCTPAPHTQRHNPH